MGGRRNAPTPYPECIGDPAKLEQLVVEEELMIIMSRCLLIRHTPRMQFGHGARKLGSYVVFKASFRLTVLEWGRFLDDDISVEEFGPPPDDDPRGPGPKYFPFTINVASMSSSRLSSLPPKSHPSQEEPLPPPEPPRGLHLALWCGAAA